MKKLFFIFLIMLMPIKGFCQSSKQVVVLDTIQTFKLYPTKNMWTFIKLDTSNGQMWQVQYSINNDSQRGEVPLSFQRLAYDDEAVKGRFCLYPTQNMYNFILLDQIDGRTWQVQWSFDYQNRGVLPISY